MTAKYKKLALAIGVFLGCVEVHSNYLKSIRHDSEHFHPLPRFEEDELVLNPKYPLKGLVINSLARYKCKILTEEGEAFPLGPTRNSYLIGIENKTKQYLTANLFALQTGNFYSSLAVTTVEGSSEESFIDYSKVLKFIESTERVGAAVHELLPKIRFEGQEYILNCN